MSKYTYRRPAKENVLLHISSVEDEDDSIRKIGINKCAIWSVLASDKSNFEKMSKLLVSIKFSSDQTIRHVIISKTAFIDFPSHRQLWNSFCQLREATVSKVRDDMAKIRVLDDDENRAPPPPAPVPAGVNAAVVNVPPTPVVITIKNLTPPALAKWKDDLGLLEDPPSTRVIAPQPGEPDDYIHLAFRYVSQARSFLEEHRTLGLEIHWRAFTADDKRERSRTVVWNWAESVPVDESEVSRAIKERASECGSTIRFNCNGEKRFGSATFSTMEEATRFGNIGSIEARGKNGGRVTIRLRKTRYRIPDSPYELVTPTLPEDCAFLEPEEISEEIEAYAQRLNPPPPPNPPGSPATSTRKRKVGKEAAEVTDLTSNLLEYVRVDPSTNSLVLAPKDFLTFSIFSTNGVPIRGRIFSVVPTPVANSPTIRTTMNEVKSTVVENASQLSAIQESMKLAEDRHRRLEDRLAEQARSFSKQMGNLTSAMISMQQANTERDQLFLGALQRQSERSDLNTQLSTITGQIFTMEILGKSVPVSMLDEQARLRAEVAALKFLPPSPTRRMIHPRNETDEESGTIESEETDETEPTGVDMSIDE